MKLPVPRSLFRWISDLAWPTYECELCVGQEWWRGCYAAFSNTSALADL